MISFFHEIDIKNGFVSKPYGKSIDEYFKDLEQQNFHFSQLEEEERDQEFNVFTVDEMTELQGKLFDHQYNEFTRIKELLKET